MCDVVVTVRGGRPDPAGVTPTRQAVERKQKLGGPGRSEVRKLNPISNFAALGIIMGSQTSFNIRRLSTYKQRKNGQQFQLLNDFTVSNGRTADPLIPNP